MSETTASELRDQARQHFDNAVESFERCDTDGFLSQWASNLNGRLKMQQADIEDNGGEWTFLGLFTAEGVRVRAKLIEGRYGLCWAMCDAEDNFTGTFVPFAGTRKSRKQTSLGLHELDETAPADARIEGKTATACTVVIYRKDDGYPADAIVWQG